ncbi:terminase [Arcanobacterium phocae]|uniref:terminase n=1 Tax=Arcanobacterium phocae TaxID=131112 RepID=UPI001C10BF4A
MSKDGTSRGVRRVRAGAKLDALNEKLVAGRPATRLEDPLNEPFDFIGSDIGDGAVLAGEVMPEPSDYLSEVQRDNKPLGAELVYRETWQWLDVRGCSQFVAPRLIESYAQVNVYWYEIYKIVRATCTSEYSGGTVLGTQC